MPRAVRTLTRPVRCSRGLDAGRLTAKELRTFISIGVVDERSIVLSDHEALLKMRPGRSWKLGGPLIPFDDENHGPFDTSGPESITNVDLFAIRIPRTVVRHRV